MNKVVFLTYLTCIYLFLTMFCKFITGEYIQTYVINSNQVHNGNVLNVHIFSSILMYSLYLIQQTSRQRISKTIHKYSGRLFTINIILLLFPTSLVLTLRSFSSLSVLDTLLLRMLFLESTFGVLAATICVYYVISLDHNNHKIHTLMTNTLLSYASTPIMDRLCTFLISNIVVIDYESAHRLSLLLLMLNMCVIGFFPNFIFITSHSRQFFPFFSSISIYRWYFYMFIIMLNL